MPAEPLENRIRALHATGQATLCAFLSADLDLAFTLLRTANIEFGHDASGFHSAITKARTALYTVRRFTERIENAATRSDIHARADKLESALREFQV